MKINLEEISKTSVLFVVTNVLPKDEITVNNDFVLKDYQKHGFRLNSEFANYIKDFRIHFYHFEQETISDFCLLDKVFSRISNSIKELVFDEKIFIIIDKEQYNWIIDSSGDQFENKITACLPHDSCPVKLDMAIEEKQIEVHQLHYFQPDGIDKQGGFIKSFTEIHFIEEPSKN